MGNLSWEDEQILSEQITNHLKEKASTIKDFYAPRSLEDKKSYLRIFLKAALRELKKAKSGIKEAHHKEEHSFFCSPNYYQTRKGVLAIAGYIVPPSILMAFMVAFLRSSFIPAKYGDCHVDNGGLDDAEGSGNLGDWDDDTDHTRCNMHAVIICLTVIFNIAWLITWTACGAYKDYKAMAPTAPTTTLAESYTKDLFVIGMVEKIAATLGVNHDIEANYKGVTALIEKAEELLAVVDYEKSYVFRLSERTPLFNSSRNKTANETQIQAAYATSSSGSKSVFHGLASAPASIQATAPVEEREQPPPVYTPKSTGK